MSQVEKATENLPAVVVPTSIQPPKDEDYGKLSTQQLEDKMVKFAAAERMTDAFKLLFRRHLYLCYAALKGQPGGPGRCKTILQRLGYSAASMSGFKKIHENWHQLEKLSLTEQLKVRDVGPLVKLLEAKLDGDQRRPDMQRDAANITHAVTEALTKKAADKEIALSQKGLNKLGNCLARGSTHGRRQQLVERTGHGLGGSGWHGQRHWLAA